jgi:hypothetical protein
MGASGRVSPQAAGDAALLPCNMYGFGLSYARYATVAAHNLGDDSTRPTKPSAQYSFAK